MEQIDIPQERRYCSKLGFSVLAIMLWSILWQFGLYWLDGWILPFRMPETLYYLLLLVGHYAVRLLYIGSPAVNAANAPHGAAERHHRSAGSGQAQSAWAGGLSSAVR